MQPIYELTASQTVMVSLTLCFEPDQSDVTPEVAKRNEALANKALDYAELHGFKHRKELVQLLKQGERSNTQKLKRAFSNLLDVIDPVTFLAHMGFDDWRETRLH